MAERVKYSGSGVGSGTASGAGEPWGSALTGTAGEVGVFTALTFRDMRLNTTPAMTRNRRITQSRLRKYFFICEPQKRILCHICVLYIFSLHKASKNPLIY